MATAKPSRRLMMTDSELEQLHVRVIALENLLIALLAQGTEQQLERAREMVGEMATYISPRPGHTDHPLTIHAAAQMRQLVERAQQFQGTTVPPIGT